MRPVTNITFFGIRLGTIVLVFYWIALFTGTHLPADLDFSPTINDKAKHFGAYFGLAWLLCYVTNSRDHLKRFGSIGLVCMVYAALDELTQTLIPGRVADVYDFVADSIGTWLAIACYLSIKLVMESRRKAKLPN